MALIDYVGPFGAVDVEYKDPKTGQIRTVALEAGKPQEFPAEVAEEMGKQEANYKRVAKKGGES